MVLCLVATAPPDAERLARLLGMPQVCRTEPLPPVPAFSCCSWRTLPAVKTRTGFHLSLRRGDLAQITEAGDFGVRLIPIRKDGAIAGIKLDRVRAGGMFDLSGLRSGDVVRSINGLELTSPERALEIYTALRDATHFDVVLERDQRVFHHVIDVID